MHNATPLRASPTFRPAGMAFGPSLMDRLVGNLRAALDQRDGYCPAYAQACAKLSGVSKTWGAMPQAGSLGGQTARPALRP